MNTMIKKFFHFLLIEKKYKNNQPQVINDKKKILNWLEKYDEKYDENIKNNAYFVIDIIESSNDDILKEIIKDDNLPNDYFEKLKSEGHRYIVNVSGDVDMSIQNIKEIPFQFYFVYGDFSIYYNSIKNLKGCPQIVGGNFDCASNQITNLKDCPQQVGGFFKAEFNKITNLSYLPQRVGFLIYLNNNKELLKYRDLSEDNSIKKLSNLEFLHQKNLSFWKKIQEIAKKIDQKENIIKENKQILKRLEISENQIKHKIKKL